jgi:hypothetical protein
VAVKEKGGSLLGNAGDITGSHPEWESQRLCRRVLLVRRRVPLPVPHRLFIGSPLPFYPDTDGSRELTCNQYNCKSTNRKEVHYEKSIADR